MKAMIFALALGWALQSAAPALAQDEPPRPGPRDRKNRIEMMERMKQMRMIEVLGLGEEEAVRFMAKRKEHEDRIRGLTEERNDLLDGLQDQVGPLSDRKEKGGAAAAEKEESKPDLRAVEGSVSKVLEQDRMIFEERKRFQDEMRQMLGPGKFAKMLLFEREFQSQLRDAMGRSMNRRSRKYDE